MKKLLLLSSLVFLLGACNSEGSQSSAEAEEEGMTDNHESHSEESSHAHSSELDMEIGLDSDSNPSVLSAELRMDGGPYEADRVRFEIIDVSDEENVSWLDGESHEDGVYTSVLENINPGTYEVVLHVNGSNELHEHTEKIIEVD